MQKKKKNSYQANGACFQLSPLYLKREDREVHRVTHKHEPQHSARFVSTGHKGTVNIKLLQRNDRAVTMTAALQQLWLHHRFCLTNININCGVNMCQPN